MTLDLETTRRTFVRDLHAAAKPPRTFDLQAYVSSPVPVLGVAAPDARRIVSEFAKAHRDLPVSDVNRLAAALWSGETFEEKALGIGILSRYARILDDASWRLLDRWADTASGWGLCDGIGAGPVSSMVSRRPARFRELLLWARSDNLWRRRIAAYGLNDFVRAGDLDRPLELLERLLYDPEFWVQRAVGTWLRECWKKDRARTEAFLRAHVRGLPPVVITVATERAPKAFREELRQRSKSKLRGAAPQSRAGPRPPRR